MERRAEALAAQLNRDDQKSASGCERRHEKPRDKTAFDKELANLSMRLKSPKD